MLRNFGLMLTRAIHQECIKSVLRLAYIFHHTRPSREAYPHFTMPTTPKPTTGNGSRVWEYKDYFFPDGDVTESIWVALVRS